MAERLGSAVLELKTDSTKYTKGVKMALVGAKKLDRGLVKTKRTASKLGKALSGLGKRVGNLAKSFVSMRSAVVIAAGVVGFALLVRKAIETADKIGKVADKVGLTTDSLQELRFAARLASVDQKTLDLAMQRFSRRVGEAAQDTGELKGTLEQYGIEVRNVDGSMRNLDDVLDGISDAMNGAKSDSERLRIAFKAFDSEGAALVLVMGKGADALQAVRDEAKALGLVIPESLIRQASNANDEFTRMSEVIKVQLTIALASLSPLVISLGNAFLQHVPSIKSFTENIIVMLGVFKGVSLETLREELVDTEEELAIMEQAWFEALAAAVDFFTVPLGFDTYDEDIMQLKARIEALTMAIEAATLAAAGLNKESEELAILIQPARFQPVSEKEFKEAMKKREQLEKRAQRVIAQTRTAQEKFNETFSDLRELLSLGKIDWETYQRAVEEAQVTLQEAQNEGVDTFDALEQAGEHAFDNLTDALLDFTETGKLGWESLARVAIAAIRDILSASIKSGLGNLLGGVFTPTVSFGTLSPLRPPVGTRREHGGRLAAGQLSLVGEAGIEAFRPDSSGTIISNADLMGSNRGDSFFIDARGADQAGIQRLERIITSLNGSIERRSVAAVREASMRSPAFFRAGR